MAKLKSEEELVRSFDMTPSTRSCDPLEEDLDRGCRGIGARWWMLLPIDLLKLGGLVLVVPSLTNVKTDFFHGDTSKAALVQSIVDSSRAVFTILVTVQLGQLSDTIGRRPLITLSVVCTMAPLMCLAFHPDNLYYYFAVFTLAGLLGGQTSPAMQAYVADCTDERDRARIFGLKGAIRSAMLMLLPSLAVLIEYYSGRRGLSFAAVSVQFVAFIASCILPESLPKEKRKPFITSIGCSGLIQTLRQLFLRRGSFLFDLAVLRFLKGMTTGTPLQFALRGLLSLTDADFSFLMTLTGFCGIIVQSLILKLLMKCGCSPLTLIMFGIFVDACFLVRISLMSVFPAMWLLISLSVFHSLYLVYIPAFTSLATSGIQEDKGFVLGAFQAVDEVTSILSPLLMAAAYQKSHVAPFLLAACLNVVCFFYAVTISRPVTHPDTVRVAINGEQKSISGVDEA